MTSTETIYLVFPTVSHEGLEDPVVGYWDREVAEKLAAALRAERDLKQTWRQHRHAARIAADNRAGGRLEVAAEWEAFAGPHMPEPDFVMHAAWGLNGIADDYIVVSVGVVGRGVI